MIVNLYWAHHPSRRFQEALHRRWDAFRPPKKETRAVFTLAYPWWLCILPLLTPERAQTTIEGGSIRLTALSPHPTASHAEKVGLERAYRLFEERGRARG